MSIPADYWDQKTACASRWLLILCTLPVLSPASRRELLGQAKD